MVPVSPGQLGNTGAMTGKDGEQSTSCTSNSRILNNTSIICITSIILNNTEITSIFQYFLVLVEQKYFQKKRS